MKSWSAALATLFLLFGCTTTAPKPVAQTSSPGVDDTCAHRYGQSGPVVARIWRGRVKTERADEYAKYLYDSGILKIRGIAGNLGAEMLRRTDGDVTEFTVISYWPSRESIKAFAGEDIEKAHFLPRDREYLIDPDAFVRHYDVTTPP